ncbi:hypothetical protein Poly51_58270 [Rubripirellula tenax]|uniref:Uncharacterized protein n=1 Tax=Rubripirellula tenax TaxID=2528015 RepID=A0A5C6EAG7_9BACT|nr:hypothetical protein [Rubripirellula tenax]TWU44761.1 hypothetical protein Poly51_58270 [Rubripirellula tenax]
MKYPRFAVVVIAVGMLASPTVECPAADPDFVQNVELPPRPDNHNYQLHVAAIEYYYIVRTCCLDGEVIAEYLYESQRAAEESAFNSNRRQVDRHARVIEVQLPLHWALWDTYDLREQARDVADDFRRWGFETDIVEVAEPTSRNSMGFTANDDMWLKIPESRIGFSSTTKR